MEGDGEDKKKSTVCTHCSVRVLHAQIDMSFHLPPKKVRTKIVPAAQPCSSPVKIIRPSTTSNCGVGNSGDRPAVGSYPDQSLQHPQQPRLIPFGFPGAVAWTKKSSFERKAAEGALCQASAKFMEIMTKGDQFTMDCFSRRFSQLPPMSQQTGILTHESACALPFKPVDLRHRDKRVEEKMLGLLDALQSELDIEKKMILESTPVSFSACGDEDLPPIMSPPRPFGRHYADAAQEPAGKDMPRIPAQANGGGGDGGSDYDMMGPLDDDDDDDDDWYGKIRDRC